MSEKTEFNSSLDTLKRIGDNLRLAAIYSQMNDYYNWFKILLIIKREAIVKMPKKDREFLQKQADFIQQTLDLRAKPEHQSSLSIEYALRESLDKYELELRDFMNEKGMLITDGESSWSATEF